VTGLEDQEHNINNLFQGRDKNIAVKYPGDEKMKLQDALTVQVHRVSPNFAGRNFPTVLAIALLFPDELPAVIYEPEP
jgi:hypothetical protein